MPKTPTAPFLIRDAALIALATGKRARNLRELAELLSDIDSNSIYYHFWGGLLRPRFHEPEYVNDFAVWTAESLRDKALAERLAVIDPASEITLEDLRDRLLDVIYEHLDSNEFPVWARMDDQFEFIRFQIVVFNTGIAVEQPSDLVDILPRLSQGSVFYHFIEGRRRNENGLDDFRNWLDAFGEAYAPLCGIIGEIAPFFRSLKLLRDDLAEAFNDYFSREEGGQ